MLSPLTRLLLAAVLLVGTILWRYLTVQICLHPGGWQVPPDSRFLYRFGYVCGGPLLKKNFCVGGSLCPLEPPRDSCFGVPFTLKGLELCTDFQRPEPKEPSSPWALFAPSYATVMQIVIFRLGRFFFTEMLARPMDSETLFGAALMVPMFLALEAVVEEWAYSGFEVTVVAMLLIY